MGCVMCNKLWLRYSMLVVALIPLALSANAVGKVTTDPNTPNAKHTVSSESFMSDERLSQKVTYEASYETVHKIIKDLSDSTGIKMYSGSSSADWKVRSRRMNIFVKDVALADLMASIARTMKFKWARSKSDDPKVLPTYRLIADTSAAAFADAQAEKANSLREELWQKWRKDWVEVIDKYGPVLPTDSIDDQNPVVQDFFKRGAIRALYSLFNEVPETRNRYLAGQGFRISTDKLSWNTRQDFFYAGNELWKYLQVCGFLMGKPVDPVGYNGLVKPEDRFDVALFRLDKGSFTPGLRWGYGSIGDTGYFHIMKEGKDYEITGLPRLDRSWEQFSSRARRAILRGDKREIAYADYDIEMAKFKSELKADDELLYPSEPFIDHKPFAGLEKKLKLNIELPKDNKNTARAISIFMSAYQKAVAEASGLGVVSDSWLNIRGENLTGFEAPLGELLENFCKQYNYNWDKTSDILEFRYRKWAKNRSNQISDELVAKWSENTRKSGYLGLDDICQISRITYDQAEESLKGDPVLGTMGTYKRMIEVLDENCDIYWMSFYNALSAAQRQSLEKRFITGAMLTPDQWSLAQVMFDRLGALRSDAMFTLTHEPNDKELIYIFRVFEPGSQNIEKGPEDRVWCVWLPHYFPPVEAKK